MRVTMTLPGETEAGSAGMQPCRGIAGRAHRDDVGGRGSLPFASFPKKIGSVDPYALKIPARRAECSLTENASIPFHAEPAQAAGRVKMRVTMTLPGETEAGSAGMQPCRGIAGRAHRDDVGGRGSLPF